MQVPRMITEPLISEPSAETNTERAIKKCCANVLTIIESAFHDPMQRNATKDLVKKEFNRTLNTCREWPRAKSA